jgi:hypothetical protein
MKKLTGAVITAVMLTLLCPGWGLSQEDPGSLQQAQQKRLLQQKQQLLLTELKFESQRRHDMGYTPAQLEQWQREQHAKIMGELKRSAQEKPKF